MTISPIFTPKGKIVGASKIARDISDRKKSQQLIVSELTHRTQNLFAVFQAIAARAVDKSKTAAEIKYVLNDRLPGAGAGVSSDSGRGKREREFSGFSRQVRFGGCDIVVNPSAAQQFALIIHELATNALKYGALSAPAGRVSIEGKIDRLNSGSDEADPEGIWQRYPSRLRQALWPKRGVGLRAPRSILRASSTTEHNRSSKQKNGPARIGRPGGGARTSIRVTSLRFALTASRTGSCGALWRGRISYARPRADRG